MENQQFKKSYSFKLVNRSRRNPNCLIENQPTLLGTYLDLRMNQKVIGALVSLQEPSGDIKTIPICFKIELDKIPDAVRSLSVRKMNLLQLKVAESTPIPILIVIIAEDSTDFSTSYKIFLDKKEKLNLVNFDQKIRWIICDMIELERKAGEKSLEPIPIERFELMQKKVEALNKRMKSSPNTDSPAAPSNRPGSSAETNKDSENPPAKRAKYFLKPDDLVELAAKTEKIAYQSVKPWAEEVLNIFKKLAGAPSNQLSTIIEQVNVPIESTQEENIRKIPDKDETYEKGTIIYIEGTLPVSARSYRAAMRSQGQKQAIENEPSFWLSNIVRECFPDHWLLGTTIRGQGGKASLVSIWNYHIPEIDPPGGFFEDGLGEKRLSALLDHVVRKTKKDFYDRTVEKHLLDSLAKYLHYARLRVEKKPKKVSKRKRQRISDDDDSDTNPTDYLLDDMETEGELDQPVFGSYSSPRSAHRTTSSPKLSQQINRTSSPRVASAKPVVYNLDPDIEEDDEQNRGYKISSVDLDSSNENPPDEQDKVQDSEIENKEKETSPKTLFADISVIERINSLAVQQAQGKTGQALEKEQKSENDQRGEPDEPVEIDETSTEGMSKEVESGEETETTTDVSSRATQSDSGFLSPSSSSGTGQRTVKDYFPRIASKPNEKESTPKSARKLSFDKAETSGQTSEPQQSVEDSPSLDNELLKNLTALVKKNPKNREIIAQLFGTKEK